MPLPEGLTASKVVAVHLNYRSRAAQRGRTPTTPSYFLKPPSSLSDGGEVERPHGARLLAFEGEIALIMGEQVREVTPEQGARAIGWYAPANDFGAHDFRWADRGSNLLAKGHDGYTPIGPALPAAGVNAGELRLRTLVNGELLQDATSDTLIFPFGQLVADLSRFMTLARGDVILAGTPAGAGVVQPGDVVEVELVGAGVVRSVIVEARRPLAGYGAMPKVTPDARMAANGTGSPAPRRLPPDVLAALREVSTATLSVQLAKRGIQDSFLAGLHPTRPDLRMVGYARTLRYVAARSDVRESMRGEEDAQKRMIESIASDDVLVIEARGEAGAGTIGDILAARLLARGGAGIVTDGGIRDSPGVAGLDVPAYFRAAHAASLWNKHIPLDTDVPVTCADTLVMPGDVVVGDAEGALVIPRALAEEVARDAREQEDREAWALERVTTGASIRGVYPLADEHREDYERWSAARPKETQT